MNDSVLIITREIVPHYYGGIGSQFKAMAQLLVATGFEVTFFTESRCDLDEQGFSHHYPNCRLIQVIGPSQRGMVEYSYSGGLVSHSRLSYALAVSEKLYKYCKHHRPAFIVAAEFGAEAAMVLLQKKAGLYPDSQFVMFVAGSTYDAVTTYESGVVGKMASELEDPQNRLTCALEDISVRLADHIISPTNVTWRMTQNRLALDREAQIIPNLVGTDFLIKHPVDSRYRQRSGIILFVGRLDRHKGADLLLQGFIDRYEEDDPGVKTPRLCFIGRDSFCKSYETTFLSYWRDRIPESLKDRVSFKGQLPPEAVHRYLCEATLCVFPSRWEVFGIVCLEAMACACPVVVSADTGLAEVVGDAFTEYCLDFINEVRALFDLYDKLLLMDESAYHALCRSFHDRAEEVANRGNGMLKSFFNEASVTKDDVTVSGCMEGEWGEIISCLHAVNAITTTVAADFNTLVAAYQISETEKKRLLATGNTGLVPVEKKQWLTSRMLEFLKKQAARFGGLK